MNAVQHVLPLQVGNFFARSYPYIVPTCITVLLKRQCNDVAVHLQYHRRWCRTLWCAIMFKPIVKWSISMKSVFSLSFQIQPKLSQQLCDACSYTTKLGHMRTSIEGKAQFVQHKCSSYNSLHNIYFNSTFFIKGQVRFAFGSKSSHEKFMSSLLCS